MAATQISPGDSPIDVLRNHRLNAVVTIDNAAHAVPVARALGEGGIHSVEITMRTPAALKSIEKIAHECPWLMVGAGTVLTPENARDVMAAGGKFCIAPDFNQEMVDYCLANSIPVFPGVATPTELGMAVRSGLRVVKVYPIEPLGGVNFLRIVSGPFGSVEWLPSGGVTTANLAGYLAYDKVIAVGCTWIAPMDLIKGERFDGIRDLAHEAVQIAQR